MDLKMLRDYDEWRRSGPQQIIEAVKNIGWKKVFEDEVPLWAHRVRNFFNVEPTSLTRLDKSLTNHYLAGVDGKLAALRRGYHVGDYDRVAELEALSGQVYRDQFNNIWYQMDAGGGIYHFGSHPKIPALESAYQSKMQGQKRTPIFKLVSFDGTGGSMETIIENPLDQSLHPALRHLKVGRTAIGEVNKQVPVRSLIEKKYEYEGSYNYSETVDAGYAEHVKRDVHTHNWYERWWKGEVYLNPPDRFLPLSNRQFPEFDKKGRRISEQLRSLDKPKGPVNPLGDNGRIWKGTKQ